MTLPQEAVDRLADAIVAVEYYMETMQAGRTDPWYMLDNAETCLRFLAEAQPVPRVEALAQSGDHARTVVIEPLSQTVALRRPEHERTAVLDPRARSCGRSPRRCQARGRRRAGVAKPVDREIDPEFLELFIEEAKDEIAKLKQLFPLWDENPQDQDALVNVRRSFHTLKGSGRMVGAQLIGEFAWSVENLLNRVINKTLERTPDMMALLREAVAAVPELVEQLETARDPQPTSRGIIDGLNDNCRRAAERAVAAAVQCAGAASCRSACCAGAAGAVAHADHHGPASASQSAKKNGASTGHKTRRRRPRWIPACTKSTPKKPRAISRPFVSSSRRATLATPPYPVTEDLHRSCHTLSGTAKTAGARQGIKIAEPLNRYVRKLYDNSIGMPAAGLARAEGRGRRDSAGRRSHRRGHRLLPRPPAHRRPPGRAGARARRRNLAARRNSGCDHAQPGARDGSDAPSQAMAKTTPRSRSSSWSRPTRTRSSMLDWSYDNFPPAPAVAGD